MKQQQDLQYKYLYNRPEIKQKYQYQRPEHEIPIVEIWLIYTDLGEMTFKELTGPQRKYDFFFTVLLIAPALYATVYTLLYALNQVFSLATSLLNFDWNIASLPTLLGFPTPANDSMYGLITLLGEMTILLSFILLGVLLAIAYIIDVYKADVNPYPRHFEKSVESTLDVFFVVFPTIIIVYLLVPSLGFIYNNETEMETVFALNIIGHQWYWSYEYNLSFNTSMYGLVDDFNVINHLEFDSLMDQEASHRLLQVDKRVIIPVNTLIAGVVTSQDVIHSWAVPQLGIKVDAIPGRLMTIIINSNVPGVFYGQCSELCGVNHAFMPICIQAVELDIFVDWVLCALDVDPSQFIVNQMGPSLSLDLDMQEMFWNVEPDTPAGDKEDKEDKEKKEKEKKHTGPSENAKAAAVGAGAGTAIGITAAGGGYQGGAGADAATEGHGWRFWDWDETDSQWKKVLLVTFTLTSIAVILYWEIGFDYIPWDLFGPDDDDDGDVWEVWPAGTWDTGITPPNPTDVTPNDVTPPTAAAPGDGDVTPTSSYPGSPTDSTTSDFDPWSPMTDIDD